MPSETIRRASVIKHIRGLANMAIRCEERAESWKQDFGENDEMRRFELVRAQAYREALQVLAENLDIPMSEFWPLIVQE